MNRSNERFVGFVGAIVKVLAVARKTFLELLRERMTAALMLFFPVAVVVFYYVAFGETDQGLAKYLTLLVLDRDRGSATAGGPPWQAGKALVDGLREAEFENSPVFNVIEIDDRKSGEIALREHKAALLLEIPADFSASLYRLTQGQGEGSPAALHLIGAPESGDYIFARGLLSGLLRQFSLEAVGWEESVVISYRFVPGTGTMSDFDFGVGGAIIFGISFIVIVAAEVLVREDVSGTLRRMRLSGASAGDLLLGISLAMLAVCALQVPITLGSALAMGFHNRGSLLLVFVIALLMSLSCIGVGLIVASFARSAADATNLASVAMVPLVFLSEALYPMPDIPIATLGKRVIQLYDLLPTTHAAEAMRRVTIYGVHLNEIGFELLALFILSALILFAGVILYQHRRMHVGQ